MKRILLIFWILAVSTSCFKKEIDPQSFEVNKNKTADNSVVTNSGSDKNPRVIDVNDTIAVKDKIKLPKISFSEAKNLNTAEGWRQFLKDNPDYQNKDEIKDRIIRAEVDEIMNDKNTGEMPASEKIRGGNRALSAIDVENDTSCDLTLRYSGTDTKMVVIPSNSTEKIQIKSGNYKVVATACGYNYAGSEALMGDYEVVYYIQTVKY